ncbi:hypothetical protein AAG906_018371 [Vitis piasezkii]
MVATNSGSIVELRHSSDGHFEQLFIAHLVSIQGSFLSKHNTRGNKGKENALQFLDSIAYARLEHDYNVSMFELWKYNDALAKWVEENEPEHWAMSKFPKQRWDKMTTNLAESFNAWLRNERHHSICTFLMEHMAKLGSMLVKHKEESNNWKGYIGPKIEEKVQQKIAKGEVYPVTPFINGIFGVSIGTTFLNVDIMKRTCTCRGWEMLASLVNMRQPLFFPSVRMLLILFKIGTNSQCKS